MNYNFTGYKVWFLTDHIINTIDQQLRDLYNTNLLNKIQPLSISITYINEDYYELNYIIDNPDDAMFEDSVKLDITYIQVKKILTAAYYEKFKTNSIIITDEIEDPYIPNKVKYNFKNLKEWNFGTVEKHFTRLGMLDILNN